MEYMPVLQQWAPMNLTGLSFFYVFLPVCLLVYYLLPAGFRGRGILVLSLVYFVLAQPQSLLLMAVSVGLDFGAVRLMDRSVPGSPNRRFCLCFSIIKNLLIVLVTGVLFQLDKMPALLGVLVYPLLGLGAVMDMYKGKVPCEKSLWRFAAYCCFSPRLYAGPLSDYAAFAPQLDKPEPERKGILQGGGRFIQGAMKNHIFGGSLTAIYLQLKGFSGEEVTVLSSWCLVLILALAVYFILSGYADMACGLGGMLGLSLPENFYYPYQSHSVRDFFYRFNSTLGRLVKSMVYRTPSSMEKGVAVDALKILAVGVVMGLWFGLRQNFIIWGMYLALFAVMEKHLYPKVLQSSPVFLSRIYCFCVVLSSFTILAGESLGQTLGYAGNMFGLNGIALFNDKILYLLFSNWLVLTLACVLATSLVNRSVYWLRRWLPRVGETGLALANLLILVAYTALSL